MELCCTSVMLPRWTLDETFDKLAQHGFQAIELRCRYNPQGATEPSFWGFHRADVSPDNVVEKAPRIRAAAARSAGDTLSDSWLAAAINTCSGRSAKRSVSKSAS